MTQNQEARIRQRAYEIWLDEGAPPGRAEANWLQAQAELDREVEGPASTVRTSSKREGGAENFKRQPVRG